ncbi:hypothetical protein ACH5RR_006998 [Cinchona calisaya]|uniref:Retroviral polymerase SH3-like domain-containing protein n=1 Tax=Cinchona calisaya TaxID=153742 RepID=A0ABD3AQJ0_9GENT
MDMVRSMMHSKNMPKSFWAEAVSCTIYVLNRSLRRCNYGRTPYETWIGKKPHISHLKVFGSLAYAHVPDALRKKLDDKAEKCIFLGYSHETKGYELFNPDTRKVIICRDVTFDQQGDWDWSKKDLVPSSRPPPVIPIVEEGSSSAQPDQLVVQSIPAESYSRLQRQRHLPARLQDYVISNDNFVSNEDIVNFALFAGCDLVAFEEAATEDH